MTARLLHPLIEPGVLALTEIAGRSLALGVAGNRADIFAAKAARAHAALRGSRIVEEADLTFAIATVLAPRAGNVPEEPEPSRDPESTPMPPSPGNEGEEREEGAEGGVENEERASDGEDTGGSGDAPGTSNDDERLYEGIDFDAPLPKLAEFFADARRSGTTGSRGIAEQWRRGRHTRSVIAEHRGKTIAVGATLRAAAPHQRERRAEGEKRVVVRGEDLRLKRFRERAGTLFIFCVDASGSMAINRMREAKGAVARLLSDAYIHRDTVALIAFRGGDAELLLPPTSSVERAKRSLDILPTGGGTPLASALMKAYGLTLAARRRGVDQVLVVVMTDGRANVPMTESAAGMIMEIRRRHVRAELEQVALSYRREGVKTLVVDTRQRFGEASEAVRLAELFGARYYFLPEIEAGALAGVVKRMGE
jgi:magnesium chelatase subunit D